MTTTKVVRVEITSEYVGALDAETARFRLVSMMRQALSLMLVRGSFEDDDDREILLSSYVGDNWVVDEHRSED